MQIALVILISALTGALLAGPWIDWPTSEGLVGVALMIGAALYMRRHWRQRAALEGDEPGEPEQEVWHGLASTSLIGAQMLTALLVAGPAMQMHSAASNRLGAMTWTLIGGALLSWYILHRREVVKDERDRAIDARATSISAITLALSIIGISIALGFNPPERLQPMTHAFLANVLMLTLVFSSLVRHALQLWGYRRDAQGAGA